MKRAFWPQRHIMIPTTFCRCGIEKRQWYLLVVWWWRGVEHRQQLNVWATIDKENTLNQGRENSGTGRNGLSRCLRLMADILPWSDTGWCRRRCSAPRFLQGSWADTSCWSWCPRSRRQSALDLGRKNWVFASKNIAELLQQISGTLRIFCSKMEPQIWASFWKLL